MLLLIYEKSDCEWIVVGMVVALYKLKSPT
jgi:hypothetical protein